jgi:hypothetical protein
VFGWEERLIGNKADGDSQAGSLVVIGIDENGNTISYPSGYFENHPTFAGLATNVQFAPLVDDGYGNCDMAWIPAFYWKFWRDPDDAFHKKYFFSPVPKDGYTKFPAFLMSGNETGFYCGRVWNTNGIYANGLRSDLTKNLMYPYQFSVNNVVSAVTAMNNGLFNETGWHLMNIWERTAITKLMIAEAITYNVSGKFGGSAWPFPDNASQADVPSVAPTHSNFHNIYTMVQATVNEWLHLYCPGIVFKGSKGAFISSPFSPETAIDIGLGAITGYNGSMTVCATKVFQGVSEVFEFDVDVLNIGQNFTTALTDNPYGIRAYGWPSNTTAIFSMNVGLGARSVDQNGNSSSRGLVRICKTA